MYKDLNLFELYLLSQQYPQDYDYIFYCIIDLLKPLINKNTYKLNYKFTEDLRQELLMSIHKVIINRRFTLKLYKTFNFNSSIKYTFNKSSDESLLINFIVSSKHNYLTYIRAHLSCLNFYFFGISLYFFVGQIKFINYMSKVIKNRTIDFGKQIAKAKQEKYSSKYIEDYSDKNKLTEINIRDILNDYLSKLSVSERHFIESFIEGNHFLKQKEVAIKFKCSCQWVSYRWNLIREKYGPIKEIINKKNKKS